MLEKKLIIASALLFLITCSIIWNLSVQRINLYEKNITLVEEITTENQLKDTESRLFELYNISKKNVIFLRDLIELDLKTNTPIAITQQKLSRFLNIDNNYFQVRLIDRRGMETIRIENKSNPVTTNTQYKGDRDYFKKALALPKGEVYISEIELNVENQEVEVPHRPTIRFFTPIYFQNELKGIVGLNLNATHWLDNFKGQNISFLNSKNEVFHSSDNEKPYGTLKTDLSKKNSFGHPYYHVRKINHDGKHLWTLYTKADLASIQDQLSAYKKSTYTTSAILTLGLMILLGIVYMLYKRNKQVNALNKIVTQQLNERDTLLKEIHHRVKNNLQVITSLLSLQSSFINDEKIKALFRYSQYRINSMAIIHEMLYKSNDLSRIDYGRYVNQLATTLIASMKGRNKIIDLKLEAEELHLNLDTSVPLGLMINEIITNSLKYGFKNKDKGLITIKFEKAQYPNYLLHIGDNGSGFSETVNFRNTKSLGLKLIHMLSLQLKGNIEKDNSEEGTHYIITFQEIEQIS
ncbi:sensor histidine kinase [Zobellia galactanivorans]|uniref:sensor histidine kinase n=1 Tax=Zobellia galactanivorans (strain DSM 12802 / CCUG 47099 / CIP 106680 / NCIMB 13871 / Dsij) TaxID=63186 RepID=UPI001C06A841|nr:sensor histidine kinase [Zobellia galactanivorans]MBU3028333.1 sensor histidine kinase [Zobellia galactanivorans]